MTKEEICQISQLLHGEHYIVPESDYGRAEIYRINDRYILFEIPIYGGEPRYFATYYMNAVENMISDIDKWT